MADEMPYRIEAMEKGGAPTVMQFIQQVANQTAATRDQIEETIKLLHGEKQIELLNSDGAPRRRSSKPGGSDFIRLSRQLIIPGSTLPR